MIIGLLFARKQSKSAIIWLILKALQMKLISNNFTHNGKIPAELAFCRIDPQTDVTLSNNRNPHLLWSETPEGTHSLVLICHDPGVPSRGDDVNQKGRKIPSDLPRVDFCHWLLANIPSDVNEVAEGAFSDGITARGKTAVSPIEGARQGINNFTDWFAGDEKMEGLYHGYDGPCPPWNDSIMHHYIFTIYALNVDKLVLSEHFGRDELLNAMEGHILEQASITGLYSLNPDLSA
jgi:Raf kinase inhibitor-like YbhB/YbcL family protein